jgi:hypothetical protein
VPPKKTCQVIEETGLFHHQLYYLIKMRLVHPQKDASGDLVWSAEDIETAMRVIGSRRKRKGAMPCAS